MTKVKLRYVEARRDRNGQLTYWYFCRNRRTWKLPGQPLSEEFAAKYQRLLVLTERPAATVGDAPLDKRSYPPGSFGALVRDYLGCARVKQLKPRTKAEYTRVLEALQLEHGDKRVVTAAPSAYPKDARRPRRNPRRRQHGSAHAEGCLDVRGRGGMD